MNVTELYRRFNMNKEEFFPLVQSLGFAIGERAIKVDDRVAQQVIKAIEDWNRSQKKKTIFAEEKTEDEFDKAFIEEMIVHHQGAIDMAQLARKNAGHDEIKSMADDIISAQTKEIDQMRQWQKDWNY